MSRISLKVIKCEQNGKSFYVAILNSKVLNQMCFVTRKKENPRTGFQRVLNRGRAKQIANYLDVQRGVIPSALIVSAQPNTRMRYDSERGMLSFQVCPDGFMVIDGQHRLYGLKESMNSYDIPVIIFDNLNSEDEVKLFIDINTTQRGVPAALILDIKNQAGTETKLEERQRLLFDKMNDNSALSGYLLPNESKAGKISRPVFYESTKPIFESGPISDFSDDIIYKTLRNYIAAVDRIFKETNNKNARINKTVLFKAVLGVFNEVCDKCLLKYGDLKSETIQLYLSPIGQLDFDGFTGTNKATVNNIVKDIRGLLKEQVSINEDMF